LSERVWQAKTLDDHLPSGDLCLLGIALEHSGELREYAEVLERLSADLSNG